jgi:hypothetical protein
MFDGGTDSPTQYLSGTIPETVTPRTTATPIWFQTLLVIPRPGATTMIAGYQGAGAAKWALPYAGDHFVEAVVSGLAAPVPVFGGAHILVELAVHLAAGSLESQVAGFEWNAGTGVLSWWLRKRNPDGSWAGAVLASGSRPAVGPDGFADVAVLRVEADTAPPGETGPGELRIFHQGVRLATVADPTPPTGEHVAIYSDYLSAGARPGPTRFEEVTAGTHAPSPIYLEPGVLIRIGVYHQRYDYRWFFRGYCDSLTPVYVPGQDDTVRIECIDALGEVGRIPVPDYQVVRELEATDRVTHILNEAEWPVALRALDDDATIMEAGGGGRVIDVLTQIAESCGGAVYGGINSGDVVFRRKDWQGYDPDDDPVDGYITNRPAEAIDFTGLVVCPSGWERSWDRQDMSTRVTYSNQSGEEVVYRNADAERRWGIEPYDRTLVTVYQHDMKVLAQRQLRLRGPDKFPRVEAVLLDAATDDDALDLMALATFDRPGNRPSNYRCQHRRDGGFVFNERMMVTGLRHVIKPGQWTLRMALDLAAPFIAEGGRWGDEDRPLARSGRWGRDTWGHAR